MGHDDTKCDKRDAQLPEVYVLGTATLENGKKRRRAARKPIGTQVNDSYCCQSSSTVGNPISTYEFDRNRFLTKVAIIDEAVQKVILTSSWALQLYQLHYPTLT